MSLSKNENFFVFFDRAVLSHYRASPDMYQLEEDDMGGRLENIQDYDEEKPSWYQIRFAFRRLADDSVCVAAFGPDIDKLAENEKYIWRGNLLEDPVFATKDTAFERWVSRNLDGSWQVEDGPRHIIERQVRLIRALTRQTVGTRLLLFDGLQLINYPIAENTDAYAKAHLELYRLIIDGLDTNAISAIAAHLKITLSNPSRTLNSLKELLPPNLISKIHKPLKNCANIRNKNHGVSSKPIRPYPAFDTFHKDLVSIAEALIELCSWLESKLNASAENCLDREGAMTTLFPEFAGPPRPEYKLGEIKQAEGKTIQSIEFGEEPIHPDKHQSEGIIIHFTDGTSMTIRVGSNASNLSYEFDGLAPKDVHTDLMIFWMPAIRKPSA